MKPKIKTIKITETDVVRCDVFNRYNPSQTGYFIELFEPDFCLCGEVVNKETDGSGKQIVVIKPVRLYSPPIHNLSLNIVLDAEVVLPFGRPLLPDETFRIDDVEQIEYVELPESTYYYVDVPGLYLVGTSFICKRYEDYQLVVTEVHSASFYIKEDV